MPNVTLQINLPILTAGEKFKTRYRELPGGSFTSNVDRTNAQFTLTGISAGQYVMEVIYVRASGEECPPTYQYFDVIADYTCPDVTAQVLQSGNTFYLHISYSTPTAPACGWKIIYTHNNVTKTVTYTNLPGTFVNIPLPSNGAVSLIVRADLCGGKYKDCFDDDVEAASTLCTPMVLVHAELIYNGPTASVPNSYYIRVQLINSTPTTPTYVFSYQETSATAPLPPDSGNFTYNGASLAAAQAFLYSWQVFPNSQFKNTSNGGEVFYNGNIIDGCGVSHPFSVQLP